MTKFEGCEETLKGYIYDATDYKKADLYIQTTNEIADNVGWNYTNGADTRKAILKMEIPVLLYPHPWLKEPTVLRRGSGRRKLMKLSSVKMSLSQT